MKTNFYHSIISRRETMKRREEKEKWNDKKKKKRKNERKRNRSQACRNQFIEESGRAISRFVIGRNVTEATPRAIW